MTTAEKIAEEIFRIIERERRILKSDLVEAAERILKMEASPLIVPSPIKKVQTVTIGGGGAGGNSVQLNPVPFYWWHGGL